MSKLYAWRASSHLIRHPSSNLSLLGLLWPGDNTTVSIIVPVNGWHSHPQSILQLDTPFLRHCSSFQKRQYLETYHTGKLYSLMFMDKTFPIPGMEAYL